MRNPDQTEIIWARFTRIHPCVGMITNDAMLFAWIVVQALIDATQPKVKVRGESSDSQKSKSYSREAERKRAIAWVREGGEWFTACCKVACIKASEVQELLEELITEKKHVK